MVQWYLKDVADDLPAAVLPGAWTAHSTIADGTLGHLLRDPVGFMQIGSPTPACPWCAVPNGPRPC